MKTAPRLIATAGLLFLLGAVSQAQETTQVQPEQLPQEVTVPQTDFRDRGYKGNVSVTNMGLVTLGIETSHGYMFDRSNYLGIAAGAYSFGGHHFDLAGLFLDYTHFMRDAQSSFRIGARLGAFFDFASLLAYGANTYALPLVEPNIGWSWVLRNGTGLSVILGAVIAPDGSRTDIAPKLTVSFEF